MTTFYELTQTTPEDWLEEPHKDVLTHWSGLRFASVLTASLTEEARVFGDALKVYLAGLSTEEAQARRARFDAYREAHRFFPDFFGWLLGKGKSDCRAQGCIIEGSLSQHLAGHFAKYVCGYQLFQKVAPSQLTSEVPVAIKHRMVEAEQAQADWEAWHGTHSVVAEITAVYHREDCIRPVVGYCDCQTEISCVVKEEPRIVCGFIPKECLAAMKKAMKKAWETPGEVRSAQDMLPGQIFPSEQEQDGEYGKSVLERAAPFILTRKQETSDN